MDIAYRAITREEFPAYHRAAGFAFGFDATDEIDKLLADVTEFDRAITAFDGDDIVGTSGMISFVMNVPGGALPTAGLTFIAVRPTHRRRGILRGMMQRQFSQAHEREEPLSALYAAEAAIYPRFDYGHAVPHLRFEIDRRHASFLDQGSPSGSVRFVDVEAMKERGPAVYAAATRDRPGMMQRSAERWEIRMWDPEPWREGWTARRLAFYEEAGEALGYVMWRAKEKWDGDLPEGRILVVELMAATPDAYAALWRFVLDLDLTQKIETWGRPVDEPLPWLLKDPRRVQRKQQEGLWVALVDVPRALEARRYRTEGRLVMEVRDAFCEWNNGRYLLEGGPEGAVCSRTTATPDVVLSAADLGALYLGGQRAAPMAWVGRIDADPATAATIDAMFGWHRPPWCAEHF
jgi:predicted acetyltransferase